MFKVRVVDSIFKIREVDGETTRRLWDTKIYNVVVEAKSKKSARFVAVDVVKETINKEPNYEHEVQAGRVWPTDDETMVYEVEGKNVARDENWRETIKELA